MKHQKGDEDEKDHNKLSRELQESLDLFGKTYDEWCTAQSKVDSSFETFKGTYPDIYTDVATTATDVVRSLYTMITMIDCSF